MKQIIILILIFVSLTSNGQNAKIDSKGNYTSIAHTKGTPKPTGHTFTDSKGRTYPVLESVNGNLYYLRTSKAGNEYKKYIKL